MSSLMPFIGQIIAFVAAIGGVLFAVWRMTVNAQKQGEAKAEAKIAKETANTLRRIENVRANPDRRTVIDRLRGKISP